MEAGGEVVGFDFMAEVGIGCHVAEQSDASADFGSLVAKWIFGIHSVSGALEGADVCVAISGPLHKSICHDVGLEYLFGGILHEVALLLGTVDYHGGEHCAKPDSVDSAVGTVVSGGNGDGGEHGSAENAPKAGTIAPFFLPSSVGINVLQGGMCRLASEERLDVDWIAVDHII